MSKFTGLLTLLCCAALSLTAFSQSPAVNGAEEKSSLSRVAVGQKHKLSGVIVKRDPDGFIIRDQTGRDTYVALTDATKVSERKSNPFRSAKSYPMTALLRGLAVQVEGRGDSAGNLAADKIKFTDDEYRVARSIETRVTPVEGRVDVAETRLTEAEQNAERLSGQIDELGQVTNRIKDDARAAQQTADSALAGVSAVNQRVSLLDDFDAHQSATVNFRVGSAVLSPEARMTLDELAAQARIQKGYVIQVAGFASADGNEELNRRLSQNRADAVVRYLIENHNLPLRRIVTPFGYGESNPIADNETREGREQNRRVEVTILVSKGLSANMQTSNTGSEPSQPSVVSNRP